MKLLVEFLPWEISFLKRGKRDRDISSLLGSDTLFGALVNVAALCGLDNLKDSLLKGEIIFSSLFPVIKGNGENIYFLPLPNLSYKIDLTKRKRYKTIKYLSWKVWEEIDKYLNKDDLSVSERFWKAYEDIDGTYSRKLTQSLRSIDRIRVGIDVLQSGSVPYFENYIYIKDDVFVYFFADCHKELLNDFKIALAVLAYEGLGGKRTIGSGLFKKSITRELEIEEKSDSYYVNLSLVVPTEGERKDSISYRLAKRGGGFIYRLCGTGKRKPFINTFAEGSIFKKPIRGQIIPFGDFYFYGRSFNLSIGTKLKCKKEL